MGCPSLPFLLFYGFVYRGLNVAPASEASSAVGASDGAPACSVAWNREFIAAAFLAGQSEVQLSDGNIIHASVRLS